GISHQPSLSGNIGSLPAKPSGSWITDIQNIIAKGVSVAINILVVIMTTAKPTVATSTHSAAGLKAASPRRRIITTPIKPRITAPMRLGVNRSESNHTASNAVHAGVMNSSAKTVANGNSVNAVAQQYWPPK